MRFLQTFVIVYFTLNVFIERDNKTTRDTSKIYDTLTEVSGEAPYEIPGGVSGEAPYEIPGEPLFLFTVAIYFRFSYLTKHTRTLYT